MSSCLDCGSPVAPEDRFCGNCGLALRPGAEDELEALLRTLMRTWSMGASVSQQSIEMCGFGEVRMAGVQVTKK